MKPGSSRYHTTLAGYFSAQPLFFDGNLQKKPHIRKCVELPFQQTKAELWDDVTDTLCNLDFIQAMACAKMTYDLVKDYNAVLQVIPDNAENISQEEARQARMEKYTSDLIACAKGEITIEKLEIPESITFRTKEQIDTEIERIKTNPTRLDRLRDFKNFLGQEAGNLHNTSWEFPHFSTQQAWNFGDSGPVAKSVEYTKPEILKKLLIKNRNNRSKWTPSPQITFKLEGHLNFVKVVAVTPDGRKAISGSTDTTCKIWNLITGEDIYTLSIHNKEVTAVGISTNGDKAISCSDDKKCILWDLENGIPIRILDGLSSTVYHTPILVDESKAILCMDKSCLLWDFTTNKINKTFEHFSNIMSIRVTPDNKILITYSNNGTYTFWDLESGIELKTIVFRSHKLNAVVISNDGKKSISISEDGKCTLWDLERALRIKTLFQNKFSLTSVAVTLDFNRIVIGTHLYCLIIDVQTGNIIKQLNGHIDYVTSVAITADGGKAFSGSEDCTCILWNLNSSQSNELIGPKDWFNDIAVTPDKENMLLGSLDFSCEFLDTRTVQKKCNLHGSTSYIKALSISADGKHAIAGSNDHNCYVWDLQSGKLTNVLRGHIKAIEIVAFTPDCKKAISGAMDMTIIFWDIASGEPIWKLEASSTPLTAAFSPDGKTVFVGYRNNSIILWDLDRGKAIYEYYNHKNQVVSVSITPDGRRAISASWDKTCIVWDLTAGIIDYILTGHLKAVTDVVICPDGRRAISVSNDHSAIIWDLNKGKQISILKGHKSTIRDIVLSPDGKRAFTCSMDHTCILWDLEKNLKIGQFFTSSFVDKVLYHQNGFVGIERYGRFFILDLDRAFVNPSESIVTIRKIRDYENQKFIEPSFDCPQCGSRFNPPILTLKTIIRITKFCKFFPRHLKGIGLPNVVWNNKNLFSSCPECRAALKFNPFIAGGDN